VDFNGNVNDDLKFEYGEGTTASYGCGATLNGEFWYFGGGFVTNYRQASKIVGCRLERQKDMAFDFHQGSCKSFTQPDAQILLCFHAYDSQACYTFDGETYQTAGSSSFSHKNTLGMADYMGSALTTGCEEDSICQIKTELMDMATLQWSAGPDYPFTDSSISHYSTASTTNAAYIIGGRYTSDDIAEFKDNQWRLLGNLFKGRERHGSIALEDKIMVIGGFTADSSDTETEIWETINEKGSLIDPKLPHAKFVHGVALYIVDYDFCK